MNHPYILTDAEFQAFIRKDRRKQLFCGIVLAFWIAAMICLQSGCDDKQLNEEQDVATAFFPSKPTYAAQVAYREDEREQLRLRGGK